MARRVIVVGIPGVGKTTMVKKLVASCKGARLANFGTEMFDLARSHKLVKHRDDMRKLPVEKQKRLQKDAATKISKMREKLVIIDTHLFVRTNEGFWPGLPFDVVRALKPTHLVLVEATPDEIAKRRANDSTRYRDAVTRESLAEELALARSFLATSSTLTGAPMLILRNAEGRQDEVARSLVEMLERATE